jgi:hypothetical protein
MLNHDIILNHIDDIFWQDMHAKRVLSLAHETHGVIESGSLVIPLAMASLWPVVLNTSTRSSKSTAC